MLFFNTRRIKYHVDNLLGSGSNSLLGWLALLSFVFVVIITVFTWASGLSEHKEFGDLLWDLTMRAVTPWEIEASMGSLPYLLVLLTVTLFGIFVLSILISLLSAIIDARVRAVSKGTQDFPFNNHIVILGWSSRVPAIIEELVIANESEGASHVLIASNMDHEELEGLVKNTIGSTKLKNTYINFRSRKLDSEDTFRNLSILDAKRIIVLGDDNDTLLLDRLKITINLRNYLRNHQRDCKDVIVEACDHDEAELINSATQKTAIPVVVSTLPARLIVETVFQPTLPKVYEELLSFEGNEIYLTNPISEFKEISEGTFESVSSCFDTSIPIGFLSHDGNVHINPDINATLNGTDRLIVVAEDDSLITAKQKEPSTIKNSGYALDLYTNESTLKRNVFLLGCSKSSAEIVARLVKSNQCSITILKDSVEKLDNSVVELISQGSVKLIEGAFHNHEDILASGAYDADTIIVSNFDTDAPNNSDLNIIQAIITITNHTTQENRPHLIAELNASDTRDMMSKLYELDFVVSDKIGSKVFAQYAENPHLVAIINKLVSNGENGIALKRVTTQPSSLNFGELRNHLNGKGGVLIGVRYSNGNKVSTAINPGDEFIIPSQEKLIETIYVH